MQKFKKIMITLCSAATVFTACSDSTTTPDHYWGYLTPETKGIYYECGDLTGKTGPEGRFNYHKGEEVTFYLGGVELGTVIGGQIVTPFSLAGHDPVPADFDTALANDMEDYPKARNIMHFLLAINELYDSGSSSYLYEELVETFESMHLELNGKTLDFSDIAIGDFQAQLDNLSTRRISLGGLNLIDKTLITGHIQDLETKVTNAQERPEHLYDYSDADYAGIPNPPVDGQVMTLEQLKGVWLLEWGEYGDRPDPENPDSAYRDEKVNFPQDNYILRFDGSDNFEDLSCRNYGVYFEITDTTFEKYIIIQGPVAFRSPFDGTINGQPHVESDFIGKWKKVDYESSVNGIFENEYEYEMTNSGSLLKFPNLDGDEETGIYYVNGIGEQLHFSIPKDGRITLTTLNAEELESNVIGILRKVDPSAVTDSEDAFFSVD